MNAPLHRELPAPLLDSAAALAQVTRQRDDDIVRQLAAASDRAIVRAFRAMVLPLPRRTRAR